MKQAEPGTATQLDGIKPQQPVPDQLRASEVGYDIMLGVNGSSPQYGLLGKSLAERLPFI
jgi:hypothetical protein